MEQIDHMVFESTGIGRLKQQFYRINKQLDLIMYMQVGMAVKYDIYIENIFGKELKLRALN